MSQPEPDLERQKRRHAGPLIGITAVLIFVAIILTWWFGTEAVDGNAPVGAETQIDGRTGAEEPSGNTTAPSPANPPAEVTPPAGQETTPAPTSPTTPDAPPPGSTSAP